MPRSEGEVTSFGFRWGPAKIERIASIEGRGYILGITTDTQTLDIYISPKGRSIRIFDKNTGAEWKAGEPRREKANRPAIERIP